MSLFARKKEKITEAARTYLPHYMVEGFVGYVCHGIESGGFLMAVFANDLVGAADKADHVNMQHLADYAKVLYNDVPRECWGSPKAVEEWVEVGGLQGFLATPMMGEG